MKYFLVFLSVLFHSVLHAQKIDQIIEKRAKSLLKSNIGSVSIGIYKDGKTYIQHFGELEKGHKNAPDNNTLYEIASVTKTFTGYLVAKAVLEKRINLDDDVRIYLEQEYPNLEFQGAPITIKHLLTHTAGFPPFMSDEMAKVFQELKPEAPKQVLEIEHQTDKEQFLQRLHKVNITTSPGTIYSYSNAGAELIGHILTSVYQQSIDELLTENFLNKLGMNNTAIQLNSEQKENLAQGYWLQNDWLSPNQVNSLWGTAGGLKSTMPDLMKFIEFNLKADDPIIKEAHRELYKESNTLMLGYFWRIAQDKYGTSYNHHGATTGTQNWIYIYPKYNLGISIIVNQSDLKTPTLLSATAHKLLKDIIKLD